MQGRAKFALPLLFLPTRSLGWKPRHLDKYAPHLSVCIAKCKMTRCPLRHLSRIISLRFISNKFPRLLAEREIIANAYFRLGFLPEPTAKLRKVECRTKKKRFFLFMLRRSNFGESQIFLKTSRETNISAC